MTAVSAEPFAVSVAAMTGDTHVIDYLKPSDTIQLLFTRLQEAMESYSTTLELYCPESGVIFTAAQHGNEELLQAGIMADAILTLFHADELGRLTDGDIYEYSGNFGDTIGEARVPGSQTSSETQTRVSLMEDGKCVLVRSTSTRAGMFGQCTQFRVTLTWDMCCGTYSLQEAPGLVAVCSWKKCIRKVRSNQFKDGHSAPSDSGWNARRQSIPDIWKRIECMGTNQKQWSKTPKASMAQGNNYVLGVRLHAHRNSAWAALVLLGLADN